MRHAIAAVLLTWFLMGAGKVHAGAVQCTCPEVSAKGTGDTSCSTTESGNECTIDFNTFNRNDERAAFDVLNSLSSDSLKYPDLLLQFQEKALTSDIARQLAASEPDTLIDVILLYVLVSAVQTNSFSLPGDFSWLFQSMRIDKNNIALNFSRPSNNKYWISAGDLTAQISYGCIEVQSKSNDYWGMFKAFWSDSAVLKQCKR